VPHVVLAYQPVEPELLGEELLAVYNAEGQCVEFSWVSGRDSAVLPAQGMIVMVGKAGDDFRLRLR
jgi:hypothetical protein